MKAGLVSALAAVAFVGPSLADHLPQWLGDSCPWGSLTPSTAHPAHDMPDTGVTRTYDFTIARGTYSPDGVEANVIVVNGQYPGPLIEANWGDWIEVTVRNNIYGPEEPTALHWHGLNQPGTPFMDGVVTVSQCPIVPGGTLTYRFRADEYGTSWYHAHYSAQYAAGVLGPIVVHGPNEAVYDYDVPPILVSDWFHDDYANIVDMVLSPTPNNLPFRPQSDSNLINGLGQYPCQNVTDGRPCTTSALSTWEFEAGKTYRLRFVNTGATAFETISLDGHTFTVIANDFVHVTPYQTESITIGVGQRTDVLVTANAAPGAYWLRAFNSPQCGDSLGPDGRGIIYYAGTDSTAVPQSTGATIEPNRLCANAPLAQTVPLYPMEAKEPDMVIELTIGGGPDETGVYHWTFNGVSYHGELDNPILFPAVAGSLNFDANSIVYNTDGANVVRVIINNQLPAPHPMHIHGHDFQVLAEGSGQWDNTITNPSNPQRRDVQMSWAGARAQDTGITNNYMVLQYEIDNAGVWPLHCHIAWHLSAGMSIMLLEKPSELQGMDIPDEVLGTCDTYRSWREANQHVEVDEGLKKRMARRMVDFMKGTDSHKHAHNKRGYHGWKRGEVQDNMVPKRDEV